MFQIVVVEDTAYEDIAGLVKKYCEENSWDSGLMCIPLLGPTFSISYQKDDEWGGSIFYNINKNRNGGNYEQ